MPLIHSCIRKMYPWGAPQPFSDLNVFLISASAHEFAAILSPAVWILTCACTVARIDPGHLGWKPTALTTWDALWLSIFEISFSSGCVWDFLKIQSTFTKGPSSLTKRTRFIRVVICTHHRSTDPLSHDSLRLPQKMRFPIYGSHEDDMSYLFWSVSAFKMYTQVLLQRKSILPKIWSNKFTVVRLASYNLKVHNA